MASASTFAYPSKYKGKTLSGGFVQLSKRDVDNLRIKHPELHQRYLEELHAAKSKLRSERTIKGHVRRKHHNDELSHLPENIEVFKDIKEKHHHQHNPKHDMTHKELVKHSKEHLKKDLKERKQALNKIERNLAVQQIKEAKAKVLPSAKIHNIQYINKNVDKILREEGSPAARKLWDARQRATNARLKRSHHYAKGKSESEATSGGYVLL